MPPLLEVRLKQSQCLHWLLILLLAVCCLSIYFCAPETSVLLASLAWTLSAIGLIYRRDVLLRCKSSVVAVRLAESGWSLLTADGKWHEVRLLADRSTITANLLCLSFKLLRPNTRLSALCRPSVCLFRDSANAEDLRRLRVALLNFSSEGIDSRRQHRIFSIWR